MGSISGQYPDWKAPSEDGELLIWPGPARILSDARTNHQALSSARSIRLQHVPLPQVRARAREFIGHEDAQLLVATGHQAELHHPGVWVKNAVIDTIARKLDGKAMHLAVDTDAPKHLGLRWPGGAASITDDPKIGTAAWSGLLDPPTPAHVAALMQQLEQAAEKWGFEPMLGQILSSLRRLTLESRDLPSSLVNATHELDWSLGLRHGALLASPIWISEAFLLFAHDLLARADEAAGHYNAALAEYRQAHGIKTNTRPMPDLLASEEAVEVPFWLDDLAEGKRTRPSLFRSDRGWVLQQLNGEEFVFDPGGDGWESAGEFQRWLNRTGHRLTPRALTLMLFTRLVLVDQFIHGIGGARYDQVTDRLIALHHGMRPPAFGVATATLLFPGAADRQRVCVPCVKQESHRTRHGALGARKRELAAKIDALPRRSPARSTAYFQMHAELSACAEQTGLIDRWQEKLHETQARQREEAVLFDRELFYAIQPRGRLEELIQKVQSAGFP